MSEEKEISTEHDQTTIEKRVATLSQLLNNCKYPIIITGSGISPCKVRVGDGKEKQIIKGITAFNPKKDKNKNKKDKNKGKYSNFLPSITDMTIVRLVVEDMVKTVISCNPDSLHRLSGIADNKLCELYGNSRLDICGMCNTKYLREFKTRNSSEWRNHYTSRYCKVRKCSGELMDSTVSLGELIDEKLLKKCDLEIAKSDLLIVIGYNFNDEIVNNLINNRNKNSKLVVINDIILDSYSNKNLSFYYNKCDLLLKNKLDEISKKLLKKLHLLFPKFKFSKYINLVLKLKDRKDWFYIDIQGYEYSGIKSSMFYRLYVECEGNNHNNEAESISNTDLMQSCEFKIDAFIMTQHKEDPWKITPKNWKKHLELQKKHPEKYFKQKKVVDNTKDEKVLSEEQMEMYECLAMSMSDMWSSLIPNEPEEKVDENDKCLITFELFSAEFFDETEKRQRWFYNSNTLQDLKAYCMNDYKFLGDIMFIARGTIYNWDCPEDSKNLKVSVGEIKNLINEFKNRSKDTQLRLDENKFVLDVMSVHEKKRKNNPFREQEKIKIDFDEERDEHKRLYGPHWNDAKPKKCNIELQWYRFYDEPYIRFDLNQFFDTNFIPFTDKTPFETKYRKDLHVDCLIRLDYDPYEKDWVSADWIGGNINNKPRYSDDITLYNLQKFLDDDRKLLDQEKIENERKQILFEEKQEREQKEYWEKNKV